jgi:transposase
MDSSLLYHGFGIKGQEVLKSEYKSGAIIVHIETKEKYLRCSECGSKSVIRRGSVERLFRTAPIGLKPVYLKANVQRLECKECGCLRQETLSYAEQKKAILVA